MTIGERIRQRRKELNISAEEIGQYLNKDKATIYRYENGEIGKMPIQTLEPLAQILKTTPAYLMGWEEENKSENSKSSNLTPHEQKVITAYRNMPEMQPSVDRLLCVENDEGLSPNEALNGILPKGEAVGGNANIKTK